MVSGSNPAYTICLRVGDYTILTVFRFHEAGVCLFLRLSPDTQSETLIYYFTPHDIMPFMLPDIQLDDRVRLRKLHPCGSDEWTIVRLGADIGLECVKCGRRVLLPRRTLARRLKLHIPAASVEDQASD